MQDVEHETDNTPLPLRRDTIFGVCAAIGQDFGFNPVWLRVALASIVLWSPTIAVSAYAALAVAVIVSRLLAPDARQATHAVAEASAANASNDPQAERMPIAA